MIGLTLAALGTSLPELAASIQSARKGKFDFIVGNIIGSNVLNLVFVLPIIGFFGTMQISQTVLQRDFYILLILSVVFILLAIALTKLRFIKSLYIGSGILLIFSYFFYITTLAGII